MKFGVTSDWHVDARTCGISRFEDVRTAVLESVQKAIDLRLRAYVFCGDLCDPDSGPITFRCTQLAIQVAQELASHEIDSIWVAGNHDVVEDGHGTTTLTPLTALTSEFVHVFEWPSWLLMGDEGGPVRFHALPFTVASMGYDVAEQVRRFRTQISELEEQRSVRESRKMVFLSHLGIEGIVPGEETSEMPRGREVMLPLEEFQGTNHLIISGHYHRRQVYTREGCPPVHVVGAIQRFTFGESDNNPAMSIFEV